MKWSIHIAHILFIFIYLQTQAIQSTQFDPHNLMYHSRRAYFGSFELYEHLQRFSIVTKLA